MTNGQYDNFKEFIETCETKWEAYILGFYAGVWVGAVITILVFCLLRYFKVN